MKEKHQAPSPLSIYYLVFIFLSSLLTFSPIITITVFYVVSKSTIYIDVQMQDYAETIIRSDQD